MKSGIKFEKRQPGYAEMVNGMEGYTEKLGGAMVKTKLVEGRGWGTMGYEMILERRRPKGVYYYRDWAPRRVIQCTCCQTVPSF